MNNRILVVDDNACFRTLMAHLLDAMGFQVALAENGQEGLPKLASFRPSLVLLDVEMPVLDGCETCRLLKLDPQTRGIPVIMVSADFTARERALDAGADAFMAKPFPLDEFQSRVTSFMGLNQAAA